MSPKNDGSWEGDCGFGGGGEGFESVVSLAVDLFFKRNFRSFCHFQEGSGCKVWLYLWYIHKISLFSWAKRTKKNVFQSCLLVELGDPAPYELLC